jgi:di/tricarboxylate transporter
LRTGQAALKEKDFRRLGLAISALFIAVTLAAIWLLIRRIEANGSGYLDTPAPK